MELVGRAVKKTFPGLGTFAGIVDSYDPSSGFFNVLYEDGDSEDLELREVVSILQEAEQFSLQQIEEERRGLEPKEEPEAPASNSGNSKDTHMTESGLEEKVLGTLDSSFDGGHQMTRNDDCSETNSEAFVLEEDSNCKGSVSVGIAEETGIQANGFLIETASSGVVEDAEMKQSGSAVDCNVDGSSNGCLEGNDPSGLAVQTQMRASVSDGKNAVFDGCSKENHSFGDFEDTEMKDCDSNELQRKRSGSGVDLVEPPEEHGRRKRRRLSDKLKSPPERALRRSARRTNAASLASPDPVLDKDKSPAIDDVSDGQRAVSESSELEEQNQKPTLPPSSNNLNIDELSIFDVFSVYACLRSFSTILFLAPFALEAFVKALKCNYTNSLIDSIHFSLLHALKSHLELLSNEGSQSASDCLRSLNWELLDLISWPVYLAEYLLIHGSVLKPSFNLCHLKLLDGEYYRQPAVVKLEILRCLCDDVIEVEAIRSELNRRTMVSELDIDTDRVVHFEGYSKRKDSMEDMGSSCLMQQVEEIADPNSDDCCLCKMDGSLICCDGCPAAYHSRCVGINKDLLPEGDWFCPECLMNKHDGQMKLSKPLQGAQLLGIDPHGRLYFGCCGYVLVSDSSESESSYYYYNRNDLSAVIEVLKSSGSFYSGIVSATYTYWSVLNQSTGTQFGMETPVARLNLDVNPENNHTNLSSLPTARSHVKVEGIDINGREPKEESVTHEDSGFQSRKASEPLTRLDSMSVNQPIDIGAPFVTSDGSTILQATTCIPVSENTHLDLQISEKSHSMNEDLSVKSADIDSIQENHFESGVLAPVLMTNPSKRDTSELLVEPGSYVNYYSHGLMASSVVEELTRRSSENIKEDSTRPPEEVISAQLKVISKSSTKFSWSGIQRTFVDAEKENCGWCFSCKNPSDRECLFRLTDEKGPEGSKMSVGLHSIKNRKTHLSSVIYHILSIEDRLRGLLSGPWENAHYSKQWRKSILKASDVSSVKPLLLILESNLRRVALSAEWLKQVDSSVALGSGSHVFTSSVHVSSKHGVGKKRARKIVSDTESNLLSKPATASGIYWWRGGRLSRQVFHWKLLPRSLAFKCGRRAGCIKVPGVSYPDGLEFSKIGKYITWRASVETSTSVAQLAFHVRDLDLNVRWSDLGNSQLLHKLSKESQKLARLFKKVIIRRKCVEGMDVKYLLDFGKRKVIPDVVTKHGVVFEESANERKKFWLSESFVPLNLLKSYEVKKQARKAAKTDFGLILDEEGEVKKPPRRKGFSYLYSRSEKQENYQCGHCKKDVIARESVSCKFCEGYFHKKHARASKSSNSEERTYTCFKCRVKKPVKVKTKRKSQKVQSEVSKIPKLRRSQRAIKKVTTYVPVQRRKLDNRKKGTKFQSESDLSKISKFPLKGGKSKKSRSRSKRKASKKSSYQSKRVTPEELKNVISWRQGQRTCAYHAYWLKGILWTKNPSDGRNIHFLDRNVLLTSRSSEDKQPICSLCHEAYDSGLIYVRCESCEDWFHGDAFGLTAENMDKVLDFRCPKCLKRSSPICSYSKDCAGDEAQLHGEENDGKEFECLTDLNQERPSGINGVQVLLENESCPGIQSTGEPLCKRQRVDTVLDSNETVGLESCTAKSEMGLVSVASDMEMNHLSCKSDVEDGIQMGVVSERTQVGS